MKVIGLALALALTLVGCGKQTAPVQARTEASPSPDAPAKELKQPIVGAFGYTLGEKISGAALARMDVETNNYGGMDLYERDFHNGPFESLTLSLTPDQRIYSITAVSAWNKEIDDVHWFSVLKDELEGKYGALRGTELEHWFFGNSVNSNRVYLLRQPATSSSHTVVSVSYTDKVTQEQLQREYSDKKELEMKKAVNGL